MSAVPARSFIRILARPASATTLRRAKAITVAALSTTRWGATNVVRCSGVGAPPNSAAEHDLLIEVEIGDLTGSPRYVMRAHDLVQRLYDTQKFLRVEADLPTTAFDPDGVSATSSVADKPGMRSAAAGGDDCAGNALAQAHDWALQAMHVPQANALLGPAKAGAVGIRVGHPDSGYSDHPLLGLDRLDLATDRDVISGDDDAIDPLRSPKRRLFNALPNPGHGTSTASVLVGAGEAGNPAQAFRGVASAATLVPIRATESVVQVFDTDVAKAVRWARTKGCHVVSMSLGGKGLFGLEDAIQEAVDAGLIVLAAAGNQVGFVTAPASYANCIAVAATNADSTPWSGSSRGGQVDVSAPGACVWAAMFDWKTKPPARVLKQSHGTSYAVAHVAGVIALWLTKHGHDQLVATYGRANVQNTLLAVLRRPGVCRRPGGWDVDNWGVGIIDAEALLKAALPDPHAVVGPRLAAPTAGIDPIGRLAMQVGRSRTDVLGWIDALLGPGANADLGALRRFEGELAYHLSTAEGRVALDARVRRGARLGFAPPAARSPGAPRRALGAANGDAGRPTDTRLRGMSPQLTKRITQTDTA